MVPGAGIEPAFHRSKRRVLPLNDPGANWSPRQVPTPARQSVQRTRSPDPGAKGRSAGGIPVIPLPEALLPCCWHVSAPGWDRTTAALWATVLRTAALPLCHRRLGRSTGIEPVPPEPQSDVQDLYTITAVPGEGVEPAPPLCKSDTLPLRQPGWFILLGIPGRTRTCDFTFVV